MLEIRNITFGYNKYKLFKDISFNVNYGEIFKISGPNGCGKTTLLNCINGFLNVDSGEIILDNKKIDKLPAYKIFNLGVKRYFSNREFYNMDIESILRLIYSKGEAIKIMNIFNYSGKQISGSLSGGERTLLYLLMSIKNAKIIILDEPFNNLDKNNIVLIRNFIHKLREKNIGVIVTDHSNNINFDKELKLEKIDYSSDSIIVDVDYDFLFN